MAEERKRAVEIAMVMIAMAAEQQHHGESAMERANATWSDGEEKMKRAMSTGRTPGGYAMKYVTIDHMVIGVTTIRSNSRRLVRSNGKDSIRLTIKSAEKRYDPTGFKISIVYIHADGKHKGSIAEIEKATFQISGLNDFFINVDSSSVRKKLVFVLIESADNNRCAVYVPTRNGKKKNEMGKNFSQEHLMELVDGYDPSTRVKRSTIPLSNERPTIPKNEAERPTIPHPHLPKNKYK